MQEPLEAGEETNKFFLFFKFTLFEKEEEKCVVQQTVAQDESFDPFCNLFHDERVSTFRL